MPTPSLAATNRLLDDVVQLRRELLHSQGDEAPNFNLFSILGVDAKEVSTHSAFLGHLLTPGATHAQGDLFLRTFLSEVVGAELPPANDWVIARELAFAEGRLDIVLRSASAKTLIVVENKIDTQDSAGQLQAYRQWLDASLRQQAYPTRLLLYLTPNGAEAKHATGIEYKKVAYSKQITAWLTSCLKDVKAPRVRNTILAYLNTIGSMNTKASARDDLDEKILAMVNTPGAKETQMAALRISRIANPLRETVLENFWSAGLAYLQRMREEAGFEHWSVVLNDGDFYQEDRNITLAIRDVPEERPRPLFCFNQYLSNTLFRWEWAVKFDGWAGRGEKIKKLTEALECIAVMEGTLDMPKKRGWDGYLLFTDDAQGMDRTLEAELAKGSEVSEYFEGGWDAFRQLEPYLRKLNDAVQHRIR